MNTFEGQTFAGYEIIAKLGEGGMGAVWKARQPLLNRFVALKTMSAQLNSNPEFIARFIREAASAAALNHPNIVQVYTAGESDGTYYFVMEFVEGESLRKRLDRAGRIEPAEAIALTLHVAEALQHAWNEAKLIHRDIKPDNIFLSVKGVVKVGDLGLAKSVGAGSTDMTATGTMMGSPHYISPEQARALKDMDFRTDIYSLGCTLFHMVSGHTAYSADDSLALVLKHVIEPPPDIRAVMPDCPPPLAVLIGKMMAKDRNQRHASYEELIAELWQVNDALRQPQPAVAATPVLIAVQAPVETIALVDANAATMAAETSTAPQSLSGANLPVRPKDSPSSISRKSPAMLYVIAAVALLTVAGGVWFWSPWTKPFFQHSNPSLANAAFCNEIAALPAEQQVARVVAKLKELNPGYDGQETHKVEHAKAIELYLSAGVIADISPVRALSQLEKLHLRGKPDSRLLADLSPLQGLPLRNLNCDFTSVGNLSPLRGIPLAELSLSYTKVTDLAPLRGVKLTLLAMRATSVNDLSPLQAMPLTSLDILGCKVADLSPLRDMPLSRLTCDPNLTATANNRKILTGIVTLKTINDLSSAEFWKEVDAGKFPKPGAEAGEAPRR